MKTYFDLNRVFLYTVYFRCCWHLFKRPMIYQAYSFFPFQMCPPELTSFVTVLWWTLLMVNTWSTSTPGSQISPRYVSVYDIILLILAQPLGLHYSDKSVRWSVHVCRMFPSSLANYKTEALLMKGKWVLWKHFHLWGPVYMDYPNISALLGCNFMDNWCVAIHWDDSLLCGW